MNFNSTQAQIYLLEQAPSRDVIIYHPEINHIVKLSNFPPEAIRYIAYEAAKYEPLKIIPESTALEAWFADKHYKNLVSFSEEVKAIVQSKNLQGVDGRISASFKGVRYQQGNPEKPIQARLQHISGGRTEVKTPAGRIDLLTETELIEIKPFDQWKSAVGQVIIYGTFYPSHKKRIHLFSKVQRDLSLVISICSGLDIAATFQIDRGWAP